MKKKTKLKKYTCPNCKEKSDYVIEWQNTALGYEKLTNGDYTQTEPRKCDTSEFEAYACPNCEENLPEKTIKSLKF